MKQGLTTPRVAQWFLYLTSEDLVSLGLYDWPRALQDMERAFASIGSGDAVVSPKTRLKALDSPAPWVAYVGYVGGEWRQVGLKWLTRFLTEGRIPSLIEGLLILSDSTSGKLLALMQAGKLTAVRTAATSALACEYLARPDASTLAVLGAGVQAVHHIRALTCLRPNLRRVLVWNRSTARLHALLEEVGRVRISGLEVVETIEQAVGEGDVVVCAVSAQRSVLSPDWLQPGSLVIELRGGDCEPAVISCSDSVFVDWRGNIRTERSEPVHDEGRVRLQSVGIAGDLADLIAKRIPYTRREKERVFFSSTGVAVEDIVLASRLYNEALSRDKGLWLSLSQAESGCL